MNQQMSTDKSGNRSVLKPAGHDEIGVAVGTAGGITAGALVGGIAAGPAGAVVGAAIGAAAGGVGSRALLEGFDSAPVDAHWHARFAEEPYYDRDMRYEDYAPAYRIGAAARVAHPQARFEDAEPVMQNEYPGARGESRLAWERAREAARASFHTEYF
ncbi:MAG: hypothetical protein JWL63_2142 [Rhodocyclales bacterium]|nr:hypothetical protein [Rhodocyclales bacterium]